MPNLDTTCVVPTTFSDVAEIEAWLLRLLSVPVPVPEKTRIVLEVMPTSLKQPLLFALPDHTRFSLIDFPLHLPLELLGVQTCLQVLTCILLEHKIALQSKDYNALSMSVMAFVTMIYPLEYMFPVIPLLPSCMSSAEQLLLAPTPFIIGFPSSFFKFKYNFTLPNDVWIVDLDTNKVKKPPSVEDLPPLPEYEGNILVQNLQKILNSMSGVESAVETSSHMAASGTNIHPTSSGKPPSTRILQIKEHQASMPSSPTKRRSSMAAAGQLLQFAANKLSGTIPSPGSGSHSPASSTRSSFAAPAAPTFDPTTIISKDTDAVDVATRIAMVRFFNSQEMLANFIEHTRTIRLYPRPVVSFQKSSFIQSRAKPSPFLVKLVETQAVEYMAEWTLCPDNVAFQRIQTGVYDPATIGDKPKWYCNQLEPLRYQIWDSENKDFYEEVTSLIRDSSSVSGAASSTGKFSDYYDDNAAEKLTNLDHSDLDEDGIEQNTGDTTLQYDANNNVTGDDIHSPYLSSNDSSPCYSSDRENTETNWDSQKVEGRTMNLNDVISIRMRKSSVSSSVSSIGSWDGHQVMQSIPADYKHDIGSFPPIRCDINKHYKPSNSLVYASNEQKVEETSKDDGEGCSVDQGHSLDSSDDENDSSKVLPDSSSCDESGIEEFDFESLKPKPPDPTSTAGESDSVIKLFESVDSDTVVPSQSNDLSTDENNNLTPTIASKTKSVFDSLDSVSIGGNGDAASNQPSTSENDKLSQEPPVVLASTTDTVNVILNAQKARVAKLIDRASTISDSKFLKQGSQTGGSSPLPKNLGGEQMGAFFDRVTSEARDAVKEAKAAIDAGKNVVKTTAMPAADAGRQKLMKNFQNFGEAFFEERRESATLNEQVMSKNSSDIPSSPSPSADRSRASLNSNLTRGSDINSIAGKANRLIGGWLGSKATGFASKMRDRTKTPFPPSKYSFFCYPTPYINTCFSYLSLIIICLLS